MAGKPRTKNFRAVNDEGEILGPWRESAYKATRDIRKKLDPVDTGIVMKQHEGKLAEHTRCNFEQNARGQYKLYCAVQPKFRRSRSKRAFNGARRG